MTRQCAVAVAVRRMRAHEKGCALECEQRQKGVSRPAQGKAHDKVLPGTQSLSGYTPNNSLDRSGGSVFLNMNGAAMVG